MYTCYIQRFKILASFCGWAGWFESYLVENPRRHIFAWCGSILSILTSTVSPDGFRSLFIPDGLLTTVSPLIFFTTWGFVDLFLLTPLGFFKRNFMARYMISFYERNVCFFLSTTLYKTRTTCGVHSHSILISVRNNHACMSWIHYVAAVLENSSAVLFYPNLSDHSKWFRLTFKNTIINSLIKK